MATIRAFTTIEQSRKLAEILPLESADMYYHHNKYEERYYPKVFLDYETAEIRQEVLELKSNNPCYSLAALLSVLPKNLNIGRPSLESNYKGYYWIQYYDEFMKPNDYKTECFNNPIDACYDLIIRLNELNLL